MAQETANKEGWEMPDSQTLNGVFLALGKLEGSFGALAARVAAHELAVDRRFTGLELAVQKLRDELGSKIDQLVVAQQSLTVNSTATTARSSGTWHALTIVAAAFVSVVSMLISIVALFRH